MDEKRTFTAWTVTIGITLMVPLTYLFGYWAAAESWWYVPARHASSRNYHYHWLAAIYSPVAACESRLRGMPIEVKWKESSNTYRIYREFDGQP
jgi:hypothetical protein